jgi:hypothetical protein
MVYSLLFPSIPPLNNNGLSPKQASLDEVIKTAPMDERNDPACNTGNGTSFFFIYDPTSPNSHILEKSWKPL